MQLQERKQKILCAVVESYIATGEPIGSKSLKSYMDLEVSPATIRNELSDLVLSGYLEQPHTSAGRVPTHKGYRYYIDNLMQKKPLDSRIRVHIERVLESAKSAPETILTKTAQVLSDISDYACVTTTPSGLDARVHKIRFVTTGRHTSMAVLITSNGLVKSRLFRCDFVVTPQLMEMFDKALNKSFVGVPLKDINKAFLQTVAASMGELSLFMPDVMLAVYDAAMQAMQASVFVSGATNLLFVDGYDVMSARNVLRFLSDEKSLSSLLNENVKGTAVYLSEETGRYDLYDSSVITTRYEIGGQSAGAIALVCPVRVDYSSLISQIEFASSLASQLIGDLLNV